MSLFRSFSEFVPYTLRHDLDVQITLFKSLKHLTFSPILLQLVELSPT